MSKNQRDRVLGALIGLAVGDALGTTLEFKQRDTYDHLVDMIGGGPFRLPVGYWTDDTSMALCLAESLIHQDTNLNKKDLLTRFSNWYNYGYNSSLSYCFDIGITTRDAIDNFDEHGIVENNLSDRYAGNGSIMRLAPAVMRHWNDLSKAIEIAIEQGKTTHASELAIGCCELLAKILVNAFTATDKYDAITVEINNDWPSQVAAIRAGAVQKIRDQIRSSGFCVHTLEAAIWAFVNTDNFRECVLAAVNLGDDADTVGAVAGQIAGAYYGMSQIPPEWLDKLYNRDYIISLAERLYRDAQ